MTFDLRIVSPRSCFVVFAYLSLVCALLRSIDRTGTKRQTGRFTFLRLNFYDHRTEDCAWFMYKAFDFIKAAEEQNGRVLVHCVQGVSR